LTLSPFQFVHLPEYELRTFSDTPARYKTNEMTVFDLILTMARNDPIVSICADFGWAELLTQSPTPI
jgi:hypothetical protein